MIDLLLRTALSNVCVSLVLALLAVVVGATMKRARVSNVLWILVLVKLITPPVVPISLVAIPPEGDRTAGTVEHTNPPAAATDLLTEHCTEPRSQDAPSAAPVTDQVTSIWHGTPAVLQNIKPYLLAIWLLGSLFILMRSLIRIHRFDRLLASTSQPGPIRIQAAAGSIASRLRLRTVPAIRTAAARISPMVWWVGGRVQVVVPGTLFDEMDETQWRWVLAHELAHVRRRDYLVRWLEWLVCVGFWWNPVVWWAQRNLRATEEICCDALVLSTLQPEPRSYVDSLISSVEYLASPALRPSVMASEINSGGLIERRCEMILSAATNGSKSRWSQACILLLAVATLPLVLTSAEEPQPQITKLISQLGATGYAERERATAALKKIGKPAIPALKEALKSRDLEIKCRAQSILSVIAPESRPPESIFIGEVNSNSGLVVAKGPYKQILIDAVNGNGVVEGKQVSADDVWIGTVNGEATIVLKGKTKKLRIGNVNGEPSIDLSEFAADEIEIGGMNGGAKLQLNCKGSVRFAQDVCGGVAVKVQAQGDLSFDKNVRGGVRLDASCRNFTVKGKVDAGVSIKVVYTGEAKCAPASRSNIQLKKAEPKQKPSEARKE